MTTFVPNYFDVKTDFVVIGNLAFIQNTFILRVDCNCISYCLDA